MGSEMCIRDSGKTKASEIRLIYKGSMPHLPDKAVCMRCVVWLQMDKWATAKVQEAVVAIRADKIAASFASKGTPGTKETTNDKAGPFRNQMTRPL